MRPQLLVLLGCLIVACDSNTEYANCVYSDDPAPTSGARQGKCPPSVVKIDTDSWREVAGILRRGENGVAGAIVHVESSEGFVGEKNGVVAATVTDPAGFFGPLGHVSLRYDISFRAQDDVLVYRGVAGRYLQPSLETTSPGLTRSWIAPIHVQFDRPVPEDQALTFFATGTAVDIAGDLERGLSLIGNDFTFPATIHAVLHDKKGDLTTATAYAKADVVANTRSLQLVRLRLEPIKEFKETKITVASMPQGFTPEGAEILVGYSRTSYRHFTTMPIGVTKKLPVLPDHTYYGYRVRASSPDGAISDSGERGFDVFSVDNKIELPAVPIAEQPAARASVALTDRLEATGKGVFEHVLVSQSGRGTIHVVTSSQSTALPDLVALGAPPLKGAYSWTVRSYPDLLFVEAVGGVDARRFLATGTSSPRSLLIP